MHPREKRKPYGLGAQDRMAFCMQFVSQFFLYKTHTPLRGLGKMLSARVARCKEEICLPAGILRRDSRPLIFTKAKGTAFRLLLVRMLNTTFVGTGVLDCPQQKNFGRELVFSADLCYNGFAKCLSRRERWRRSRRRGLNCAQRTLSPAIAGALPKGEPMDALVQL